MLRMLIRFSSFMLGILVVAAAANAQTTQNGLTAKAGTAPVNTVVETDRSRDGLVGPVRRVRTEVAKLVMTDGRVNEGKHVLVELSAYDLKGNKIENQYFPIAGGTLTGKEVYKYDDKGNISEMTLLNPDGTLLSKEIYKYEFDFAGNWNKMTTSVAVVDSRGITFEPSEVTYRSIMYYLDDNMMKMVQSNAAATTTTTTPAPTATQPAAANPTPNPIVDPKANSASKGRNSQKTTTPDLPAASNAATQIAGAALDVKSPTMTSSQPVPVVNLDSEPPPPPGPRPILQPISGGVLNGTAITLPQPTYPEPAKRARVQGIVSVDVVLDESGKVISANASSGPAMLRDAAVQAALKARFSPTKLSGQP